MSKVIENRHCNLQAGRNYSQSIFVAFLNCLISKVKVISMINLSNSTVNLKQFKNKTYLGCNELLAFN